jgi:serine protease Do
MKKIFRKPLLLILGVTLLAPAALLAQPGDKEKTKDKEKAVEEVIIIRKSDKAEKVVVEVNGEKVTVNGKPLDEYKGDDVSVQRHKVSNTWAYSDNQSFNGFGQNNNNFRVFTIDSNRAMLGVTTEKADKGVEIQDITKESGAAKAGLKEGDIIVKIGDKPITNPDQLSATIKSYKPGDKVAITYRRDDKEQTTTAELGRYKGRTFTTATAPGQFKYDMDMNMGNVMPRIEVTPRTHYDVMGVYAGSKPRLGLSVQDTDDGKGVKVIEVDDEGYAEKAGIKNDDVITEVEGKAVKSADEVAKIIKDSKDKNSIMIKLLRGGKTHNIEVKIPRKLKTADL